ncbi:MAG: 4Fe-4S binding protein [Lachnospiraceae bacterium]|nr:4Fe-4S binding protein [Lachnospiraceae bacterium]
MRKIAVLSGKGGAGKTYVAVNLAAAAGKCTYIDCDVEEPNGRLFWKPEDVRCVAVNTMLPAFDAAKCTGCKDCVRACRFHALVYVGDKPRVFSEVCHSCGLCQMICPEQAVTEAENPIGVLEMGHHGSVNVVTGILNPGEASGVPVIRKALEQAGDVTIVDCPPGSACSVMESIMDADYCVLVVEPTAFGFHNFRMVYELANLLEKKCGVVINKQTEVYLPLEQFCAEKQLPVLARISYDSGLAGRLAGNEIVSECVPEQRKLFADILEQIGGVL